MKPVRTTIIYGLLGGLLFIPCYAVLKNVLAPNSALRFLIWLGLAGYALLLARWSKKNPLATALPLTVVLAFTAGPLYASIRFTAFIVLTLAALAWIRSSICFPGSLVKSLSSEAMVSLGGLGLVLFFTPNTLTGVALGIWLFFLVQSSFFLFRDLAEPPRARLNLDRFETARREADKILSSDLG